MATAGEGMIAVHDDNDDLCSLNVGGVHFSVSPTVSGKTVRARLRTPVFSDPVGRVV